MAKLRALGRYSASDSKGEPVAYTAGDIIHVNDAEAARLLRDSPGTFEVLEGLIAVGGPDEFVTPPADPVAPPAPVRGQDPLHAASTVADPRVQNPDGTTTPAPSDTGTAPDVSGAQEGAQTREDGDPGDTTSGPPAGAGTPDEPPQTTETPTPEGADDKGAADGGAGATKEDEGDVNVRTMNRVALVALIKEQGLGVKHVGKTTDAVRAGVKNALDARAKGGLTR